MKISKIIKALKKYITDKDYRFIINAMFGKYDSMPDDQYLKKLFAAKMKRKLDLENPVTFNEKLQWLKLYDRKPEYTKMVDKYLVRDFIAEKIGSEYLIPLIGAWDSVDEIDFDALPNQFVLKCNHNSGLGMCICTDKTKLDIEKVKKELKKGLKQDYYLHGREWPYKEVPRKIIAEKYMQENSGNGLRDFKFLSFNGTVKCSFVCSERFSGKGLKVTFFDRDWQRMPFERHYRASTINIAKPNTYDEMLKVAEKLSEGMPFIRVDLYEIEGKIYFGELTHYPGNGMEEFSPEEWDKTLGDWIILPDIKTNKRLI
jgi:hypothetical protein